MFVKSSLKEQCSLEKQVGQMRTSYIYKLYLCVKPFKFRGGGGGGGSGARHPPLPPLQTLMMKIF